MSSTLESHGRRSAIIWEIPDSNVVGMEIVKSQAVLKDWIWYVKDRGIKSKSKVFSLNNGKTIK